ncbi:MAG: flavin reductase family protein [Dissulfuribacterales bacterium]
MQELISRAVSCGVYIITARASDKINGMTAAWVTQVSFKPALVGVAVARQRYTYELIEASKVFCINAVSREHVQLAKDFGFKSGRKMDKFANVEYINAPKGSPIIKAAYAYLECAVTQTVEMGDHIFVVGNVEDGAILYEHAEPLIFRWGDFFGGK